MSTISPLSGLSPPYPSSSKPETAAADKTRSQPTTGNNDPQLQQLQQRDRVVRAHEQAHLAASSGLAMGGASFSYQLGSDGKQYAIGGEVRIDVSPGQTPQETLSKAQQKRSAALAPADPSPQDRAVAAQAAMMQLQANAELAQQQGNGNNEAGKRVQQGYDQQPSPPPQIDTSA